MWLLAFNDGTNTVAGVRPLISFKSSRHCLCTAGNGRTWFFYPAFLFELDSFSPENVTLQSDVDVLDMF